MGNARAEVNAQESGRSVVWLSEVSTRVDARPPSRLRRYGWTPSFACRGARNGWLARTAPVGTGSRHGSGASARYSKRPDPTNQAANCSATPLTRGRAWYDLSKRNMRWCLRFSPIERRGHARQLTKPR
jgi:hypothetical protein